MQCFLIVLLSIFACVVYGVVHDQVTARICVEYFTVDHPPIFHTDNPTLLGLGWGVIAMWWVGVLVGVPLATVARTGRRPKRSAWSLVRPVAVLMLFTAGFAALAGIAGFVAASNGWVTLVPAIAAKLPQSKTTPFLVDLWIHNASYTGGFVGGIFLMGWVWRSRIKTQPTPGT
jgi:hypothetical protein